MPRTTDKKAGIDALLMVVVSTFEQRRRPVKPGIAAASEKIFIPPLPGSGAGVHNARPATVGSPELAGQRDEKRGRAGVDGPEICCKMCGSLGHFGERDGTRR
ncbi:hypothetical protein GCM10027191_20970 [Novilysobacter erysipheiresistens]